jgi:hypothetical protein
MTTQTTPDVTDRPGYDALWLWFGLSYASFLTLPRVLMHEMPDEWQARMAALLAEYDATFDTSELPNTTVRAVREGKLVEMPEFPKKYRRPEYDEIAACKKNQ